MEEPNSGRAAADDDDDDKEKNTQEKTLTIIKTYLFSIFFSQTQTKKKKKVKNKHLSMRGIRRLTSIDGDSKQWMVDDERWWTFLLFWPSNPFIHLPRFRSPFPSFYIDLKMVTERERSTYDLNTLLHTALEEVYYIKKIINLSQRHA